VSTTILNGRSATTGHIPIEPVSDTTIATNLCSQEDDLCLVFSFITLRSDARFLKDAVGGRAPSRPAFTQEFTFFYAGGTVRSDGLEMTWQSNHSPSPPLQVGEEVLAFLVRSDEPRGLQVQFGAYGLLRVQGGKVTSARKEVSPNLSSSDAAELHRKVQSLVTAPKR
jgi:hypothetical protein